MIGFRRMMAVVLVTFVLGVWAGLAPSAGAQEEAEERVTLERYPEAGYAEDVPAEELDKAWYVALDLTYNSKYVWRGINVTDDHVLQPAVTVGYEGLSFNIWGNRDLTDENDMASDFNEIDFTVDYSWEYEDLGFSVGAIRYTFPHGGGKSTTELYGAVAVDTMLSPTLAVYADVEEADGAYATLGVAHSFGQVLEFAEGVGMAFDVGATVGFGSSNYNEFYFGQDKSAFTDLLLEAGFPIDLGDGWALTPAVYFSQLLDDDIRDSVDDDTNVWGGVTLSYAF